jgi:hypothetical protein
VVCSHFLKLLKYSNYFRIFVLLQFYCERIEHYCNSSTMLGDSSYWSAVLAPSSPGLSLLTVSEFSQYIDVLSGSLDGSLKVGPHWPHVLFQRTTNNSKFSLISNSDNCSLPHSITMVNTSGNNGHDNGTRPDNDTLCKALFQYACEDLTQAQHLARLGSEHN